MEVFVSHTKSESQSSSTVHSTSGTQIDASQTSVNGWVRIKLYKGNVIVVGRDSKTDSLFDSNIATFEDDKGAYNQSDAEGFIKLNAMRMRIASKLWEK